MERMGFRVDYRDKAENTRKRKEIVYMLRQLREQGYATEIDCPMDEHDESNGHGEAGSFVVSIRTAKPKEVVRWVIFRPELHPMTLLPYIFDRSPTTETAQDMVRLLAERDPEYQKFVAADPDLRGHILDLVQEEDTLKYDPRTFNPEPIGPKIVKQ